MPQNSLIILFLLIEMILYPLTTSKPEELRIGVLLPVFKTEKNDPPFAYDSGGHNRFAGLYLAVYELNNKNDGIHDDLLPDTNISFVFHDSKRDAGEAFFAAFDHTTQSYNGLGVHALIGAASSGPSANAQLVCTEAEIPQISYSSSSSSLANDVEYPFFARTVASDDFQARVIVDLIYSNFRWTTITTIAGTDLYSTSGIEAIQTAASSEGLEVLGMKSFVTGQDFSEDLLEIRESGVRIIVLFSQAADGYEVISQAYELDMFGIDTGFVWIFSDTMAASDFETLVELYGEDLSGTFYVQSADPSGDAYDDYVERLRSLPSKLGNCTEPETSIEECDCNPETDADGNFLWIRDHDVDSHTAGLCVGIDFPNDDVNTYNPYAYDATILLAKAAHELIENQDGDDIDGDMLFEHLVNVSYDGVTGFIDLGNNAAENQKGERLTGVRYNVKNYISVADGLQSVGEWDPETGFTSSGISISFPTSDNSQPAATVVPECKVGEVLPAGSQVCLTCYYGSFSKVAGETSCHDCPEGAVCYGGSHIKALRGYWRFPDSAGCCDSDYDGCSLAECNHEEACDGDILLSTQSNLFLDANEILLGQEIDEEVRSLLDGYCFSDGSYTHNCTIIVQGHSFALAESPDAISENYDRIQLDAIHSDSTIGTLRDAEVYLSIPEGCGVGYEGNLCAQCNYAENYGRRQFGVVCEKCPESLAANYLVACTGILIVGVLALMAITMKLNRSDLTKADSMGVIIKIFMSWGQLTTFLSGLSLSWPVSIHQFLQAEAMIFNLEDRLISVDCIFNQYVTTDNETTNTQAYHKIVLFLCLPFAIVVVTCVIWTMLDGYRVWKIKKYTWDREYFEKIGLGKEIEDGEIDQNEIQNTLEKLGQRCDEIRLVEVKRSAELTAEQPIPVDKFQATYIKAVHQIHIGDAIMTNTILLFLLYPSISLFAFRIFTCLELGDGKFFLEDDLDLQCFTESHTKFAIGIGFPAIVMYVAGIPFLMMYMVYRERNRLGIPHNMLRIGFLYEGYAGPFWWWEGWVMLRKFGTIILIVFASQIGTQSTAVLVHGIMLIALFVHIQCQPFGVVDSSGGNGSSEVVDRSETDGNMYKHLNQLETWSLVSSVVTLSCGLIFESTELSLSGTTFFMLCFFIVNICFVSYAIILGSPRALKKCKKIINGHTLKKRKKKSVSPTPSGEEKAQQYSSEHCVSSPDPSLPGDVRPLSPFPVVEDFESMKDGSSKFL